MARKVGGQIRDFLVQFLLDTMRRQLLELIDGLGKRRQELGFRDGDAQRS